jgi:hypothetical protein
MINSNPIRNTDELKIIEEEPDSKIAYVVLRYAVA